jgi:uncharacterized protein YabE (DUF348 family)
VRARPRAVALHGALLVVLVAGPLAYVTAGKSVTVQVDASTHDVRTYASTVRSVLEQQHISVGAHDVVAPALSAQLSDGMRVAVLRGRQVRLVVDGLAREVWTTTRDVTAFVSSLGARYSGAYLSVSRSARIPLSGLAFDVRMPKSVTVVYGGHPAVIVTTAATWADAMTEAGLGLGSTAELSVPAESAPLDGEQVSVVLTGLRTVTRTIPVPFTTVKQPTTALYVGSSRVLTEGSAGRWSEVWRYTLHDGVVVASTRVSRLLVAQPVTEVIEYGTRRHIARSSGYPSTSVDGLNWGALAHCESGGNATAVGGNGTYFGLYQFSLGAWASVGGSGSPVDASAAEQTYRAKLLYERRGAGAWPYCGQFL